MYLAKRFTQNNQPLIFLHAIGVFLICFILSKYVIFGHFADKILLFHTVAEIICLTIAFVIYLLIWFTYERNNIENQILGFGFLAISIFQFLHIITFSYISDYNLWFMLIARSIELLIIFLILSSKVKKLKLKKKTGIYFTVIFSITLYLLVLLNKDNLPVLYNIENYLSIRFICEIFLFLITLTFLLFLIIKKNPEFFLYGWISQGLLLMLLTSLSFILIGKEPTSYFNILAHIIRVSFYIILFDGIFGRAVNYPYEKLEEILNHLSSAVITCDNNLRLTFANKRAEEIVGVSLKEWYGYSAHDIKKIFIINFQKHLTTKITGEYALNSQIYTIDTHDNEQKKIVVDFYRLESGGYQCIFDEAKKVEALDNLLLQTQTILNSINNIIIILDTNQRIIMCNKTAAQSLGISIEDLTGLNFVEFIKISGFSDFEKVLRALSTQIKLDTPMEITFCPKNSCQVNLLLQIDSILNIDGELIGSIGVGTDITDLIKDKEEKQQQEKLALLGQMAAGIVHEIRNPLTAILGFSSLIKTKTESKRIADYANYIEEEVLGLNKIVSNFLIFARPSPLMLKDICPNTFIESIQPMLDSHTLSKGISMAYDLDDNIKSICADEGQIKQVILNIVQNATDVLSDIVNAEIKISTGSDDLTNQIYISIHNNGRALTREEKIKIGTPFFTTKAKGTGLGLSICHQIIKDHGGQIKIKSEEGVGTAFELYFPIIKDSTV